MRIPLFDRRTDYLVMGTLGIVMIVGVVAVVTTCIRPDNPATRAHEELTELKKLSMAVDNYYIDTGALPESLQDLIRRPGALPGWEGPYANPEWLLGPQGQRVQYDVPGAAGPYDLSFRQR